MSRKICNHAHIGMMTYFHWRIFLSLLADIRFSRLETLPALLHPLVFFQLHISRQVLLGNISSWHSHDDIFSDLTHVWWHVFLLLDPLTNNDALFSILPLQIISFSTERLKVTRDSPLVFFQSHISQQSLIVSSSSWYTYDDILPSWHKLCMSRKRCHHAYIL